MFVGLKLSGKHVQGLESWLAFGFAVVIGLELAALRVWGWGCRGLRLMYDLRYGICRGG